MVEGMDRGKVVIERRSQQSVELELPVLQQQVQVEARARTHTNTPTRRVVINLLHSGLPRH
jgi:hypothetical protein